MAVPPPSRFSYAGRPRTARPGEVLLEALSDDGLPQVVRSVRYHRPRAPFCGMGYCTGCLVRVNDQPNVRSCRVPVRTGDRVESENSWPSPRFDVLGALDLLFPHGIDTLRGFRRPAWATRAYQRVVRRLSGYGSVPTSAPPTPGSAPRLLRADVVVVGAGPAGRAAANEQLARGARTVLVDREARATELDGAVTLRGATAAFLPPPRAAASPPFVLLGADEEGGAFSVRSPTVVVATGSYDAGLLFEGNDRPGVVTADLALRLGSDRRGAPFRRAVVVGGGPRAAAVLARLGPSVGAIVAPGEIRPEVTRRASDLGIPLYPRSLVVRAIGRRRVRSLRLRTRGGGPPFELDCDSVILAHRRLPNAQLLFQAGARMVWRPEPGGYFPELGPEGATSVAGLWAVGSVAGPSGPVSSLAPELEGYYRELLREPRRGKWIACACEDVLLEEVERAVAGGYRGIEVVKRYSGLGTGLCQGRYCLPDALLVLAIREGRPPPEVGFITQRPPVAPTRLDALASLREEFVGEAAE